MANEIIERTLQLKCGKRTFVDEDKKKEIEYDVFYVTIGGLDIRLRPSDSTARDLLLNFYNMANEIIERTLQLKCGKRTFVDEDKKKEIEYDVFYVTIGGLDIRLRPSDSTARDLLLNFYNQE